MGKRTASYRDPGARRRHLGHGAILSAILLLVTMPSSAIAQSAGEDGFPNLTGMGVALVPDYPGARSRSLAVAPILNYHLKNSGRLITAVGPVATFNLLDHRALNAGPILRYKPGRSGAVDPLIAQLQEIDASVDTGASISYGWLGKPEIPWRLRIWASAFKSLADGGVTDADSIRSSLPAFHPGRGTSSQDLWLGATFLVTKNWALGTGVYGQQLTGNAAESPIVTERGRQDQVTVGAGLAYIRQWCRANRTGCRKAMLRAGTCSRLRHATQNLWVTRT